MCTTAVVITGMGLISYHISRRTELPQSEPSDEVLQRLDRIEQIVETTAVEVERVSEANRFVAKLLAERSETVQRD